MHEWQTIYKYSHVITVGTLSICHFILIDNLSVVVMYVLFVDKLYIALLSIIKY